MGCLQVVGASWQWAVQTWAGESAFELFLWKESLALWESGGGVSNWSLFGIVGRRAQGLAPLQQEEGGRRTRKVLG